MTETATKPDASQFIMPGTIAERVDLLFGTLTQSACECMILATGAFPTLTEGEAPPAGPYQTTAPARPTSWQAARSAELRDGARLTEAGARLLAGYAKLRGQFSQDFTIRHSDRRKGADAANRQRNTTVTHRFSVPAREAMPDASVDPKTASEITQNLSKVAREAGVAAAPRKPGDMREEIVRKLGEAIAEEAQAGASAGPTDGDGDIPTPSPGK